MNIESAIKRKSLYDKTRNFFDNKNYLEVDTPILSESLIPESSIDNFETNYISEFRENKYLYLLPSPELYMKQLIKEWKKDIYQICHCFRNCEQIGAHHNIEFSMLEYYSINKDENYSLELTQEYINSLITKDSPDYIRKPIVKITMEELFKNMVNLDLTKLQKTEDICEKAKSLGLKIENDTWEQAFFKIFLTFIEPNINKNYPIAICDYPKQLTALAKEKNKYYRARWELYINGIEIANCYNEMTDKKSLENLFEQEYVELSINRENTEKVIPNIDMNLIPKISELPQCSGVALGLDRLLMALEGKNNIDSLILFNLYGIV